MRPWTPFQTDYVNDRLSPIRIQIRKKIQVETDKNYTGRWQQRSVNALKLSGSDFFHRVKELQINNFCFFPLRACEINTGL